MAYIKRTIAVSLTTYTLFASSTVLSFYLTRKRMKEDLVNFCQVNQTQAICESYNSSIPLNQTADSYTPSDYTMATFSLIILLAVSTLSALPIIRKNVKMKKEGSRINSSRLYKDKFNPLILVASLLSSGAFYVIALSSQFLTITEIINRICPTSTELDNTLTSNCNDTFPNINQNEFESLSNLFHQLKNSSFQNPQFLLLLVTAITLCLTTAVIASRIKIEAPNKQGCRLFCCKRNPEHEKLLEEGLNELEVVNGVKS